VGANRFILGEYAFLIGALFVPTRLERGAYRAATVTLAIIIFARPYGGWTIAIHRFLEVSIGIAVAFAITPILARTLFIEQPSRA